MFSWPWTNFHELNLDWIMRTVKKLETDVATLFRRVPPPGGTSGQVLSKASNDDYDYEWTDPGATDVREVPTGATSGQVLTAGQNDTYNWQTPPEHRQVPSGGASGQVLTSTGNNQYEWQTPQSGPGLPDPTTATDGQVLTADGVGGCGWENIPAVRAVPLGGNSGQVLKAGNQNAYMWGDVLEVTDATGITDGQVLTADGDGNYAWRSLPYPASGYDPKSYTIELPAGSSGSVITLTGTKAAVFYDANHTAGTLLVSFERYGTAGRYVGIPNMLYVTGSGGRVALTYIDTDDNSVHFAGVLNTGSGSAEMTLTLNEQIQVAIFTKIHIKWLAAGNDNTIIRVE